MHAQLSRVVREDHGKRGHKSAEALVLTQENVLLAGDIVWVFDRTPAGSVGVETVEGDCLYIDAHVAEAFGY